MLVLGFGWFGEFKGFEGFDTPFILLILLSSLKCFDDLISHKIKLLRYVIVFWDHFRVWRVLSVWRVWRV